MRMLFHNAILLYILLACCTVVKGQQLTYYGNVKPIIEKNCTGCHRNDGIAPFSLGSYNEVAKHSAEIMYTTTHGLMPPWKADKNYTSYARQRGLTMDEIQTIKSWITQGMPTGKEKDYSAPVSTNFANTPQKPDFTVKMPFAFKMPPVNRDTVVYIKIPFETGKDTFLYGYQFMADNKKVVHHATFMVHDSEKKTDIYDYFPVTIASPVTNEQGVTTFETFGTDNLAFVGGYTPGQSPMLLPDGIGFAMPKKGFVLLEMHYGPSPTGFTDRSYINFYFATSKVERIAKGHRIGSGSDIAEPYPPLVLPPETQQSFTIDAEVPYDMTMICFSAHMHYLGKTYKAYAVAGTDTIPLIKIDDWDFYWQEYYFPEQLIYLPKGSKLHVEGTFDNTSRNPKNPSYPAKLVKQGLRTTDEMLQLSFMEVSYKEGDEIRENK